MNIMIVQNSSKEGEIITLNYPVFVVCINCVFMAVLFGGVSERF